MKALRKHIAQSVVLIVVIMGCSRPNIIPRGELAEIYAEMLILDQWISSNFQVSSTADTTFVYGEILESRGYTREDYIATVTRYMRDPNKFSKVIEKSQKIIEKEIEIADYHIQMEKYKIIKEFPEVKDLYFYIEKEPYMHCYDSLGRDTIQPFYIKPTYTQSDTIWDGITFTIRDSVEVKDSFPDKDSLKKEVEIKKSTQQEIRTERKLEKSTLEKAKTAIKASGLKEIDLSVDTARSLIRGVKR